MSIEKFIQTRIAEQATGCAGSGGYVAWAEEQGYPHCQVLDWTSSAGDWSFLVSVDGEVWYVMTQTNNYPRAGFTRHIDTESYAFIGSAEEALQQASDLLF